MKYCPTCQSQYTDDSLKFCLQDGSPLQNAFSPTDAAAAGETSRPETETIVAARPTEDAYVPRATAPPPTAPPAAAGSSNTAKAVFLTAFLMLLFFSLAGIGLWFYFRGLSGDRNANMVLANANRSNQPRARNSPRASDAASSATPNAATAANTAVNTAANASPAPSIDREEIRREVGERIDGWRADTESFDVDDYMSHYAETVDYYNRRSASRAFVRGDKERAFARFDDVRMEISNLTITPDADDERATAVFDKEWEFSGREARSAGKVQSELQLRKIGGRWLITSERDLKIYRTE